MFIQLSDGYIDAETAHGNFPHLVDRSRAWDKAIHLQGSLMIDVRGCNLIMVHTGLL
jgi:hypothetical protein